MLRVKLYFLHPRVKAAFMTSALLTEQAMPRLPGVFCIKIEVFKVLAFPDVKIIQPKKKPKGQDLMPEEKSRESQDFVNTRPR